MKAVKGLFYTKEHEWVKVKGEKAYIGITDYAQKALGDIVFVELPEIEAEFSSADAFAVIESVKAASDVYMPLDGKVVEINADIVEDPALINTDAYEHWMVCVEMSNKSQLDDLMDSKEYEDFCIKEE